MKDVTSVIPNHLSWERNDSPQGKNKLAKDDFMNLLLTQLQHQDPLNPMDHKEFASQLAEFGSLEQLTNIDKGIADLKTGADTDMKLAAMNLIGKNVQADGANFKLQEGGTLNFRHSLGESVKPVRAMIYSSASGQVVRDIDLSKFATAQKEILWDGKDNQGQPLPSGDYAFRVLGVDQQGQVQESTSNVKGVVTGVDVVGDRPVLVLKTDKGNSTVGLDQIKKVEKEVSTSQTSKGVEDSSVGASRASEQLAKDGEQSSNVRAGREASDRGWMGMNAANFMGRMR